MSASDPGPELSEATSRQRLQEAVEDAYEVGSLVGRGGFAEVFQARDPKLDRMVAVKVLRPDLIVSRTVVERFQREARTIARLRHPHVIEVYGVGEKDGVAWYVMPFVRGESLRQRLDTVGSFELDEASRILAEAVAGLGAAHRAGLVHRDVKPDNILLEGDEDRVILTDFGIAKAMESEEEGLTGSRMFVGTPHFMSPEQASGDPVDHRADLYSLGVVGFRMVAGRLPFEADSTQALLVKHLTEEPPPVQAFRNDCPDDLAHAIDRCLLKDPALRWEDAEELLDVLKQAAGDTARGATVEAKGVGAVSVGRRDPFPAYRRTVWGFSLAVPAVLAVDLVATGAPAFSLPVALVAATVLGAGYREVSSQGYTLADVLKPGRPRRRRAPAQSTASTEAGHFGRHLQAVKQARTARASILGHFHRLTRAEQDRFPGLMEAVDHCVTFAKQMARTLANLESREDQAGGRPHRDTPWTPDGVMEGELKEARTRTSEELKEAVEALEQIRHWLARSGGADSEAVHDQLLAAVERARSAARRHG